MGRRRRSTPARKRVGLYTVVIFLVLVPICLGFWWSENLKPVADSGQEQVFVLQEGMSASQIAKALEEMGIIRSAEAFRQLCRVEKADAKLKAGMYYLSPALSSREILDILLQGPEPDYIKVTIPEGYTVAEIVSTLAKNGLGTEKELYQAMQSFGTKDYSFLKDVPDGETRLEGFLFPDTYFFDRQSTPREVINRFLERFEKELTAQVKARLEELNTSVYAWVTKASIVEREAVKQEERAIIAGVFENRLRLGMPLQSCATVQYILGEVKPVLSIEDTEIDSPYNTYKYPGLPPGPIANPGHASLNAALYPAQTDYLYFVAKNDGTHAFATTYNEHLQNVNRYQQ
ncbi:MAG TPA: endolytic transglycosylase MltG [Peptococcaceae bacterium]|nr:endolytic transglycosylase MltG [Peptococcaceae bacterium]